MCNMEPWKSEFTKTNSQSTKVVYGKFLEVCYSSLSLNVPSNTPMLLPFSTQQAKGLHIRGLNDTREAVLQSSLYSSVRRETRCVPSAYDVAQRAMHACAGDVVPLGPGEARKRGDAQEVSASVTCRKWRREHLHAVHAV